MPVYNAAKYVGEAIQSILDQTFHDFEFIIINDGSTDNSLEIVQSFRDHRIKILNNSSNIGNYPSRNKGLRMAKGEYICVMDSDDVATKLRLERQYLYMDGHHEIGMAGSGFRYYGREQDIFRENDYEKIKVILLRNNCFIHPTLIIRRDYLQKFNLWYDEKYYFSADYDLIARAARHFRITNIPEVLLYYRIHEKQITIMNRKEQMKYADNISIQQLGYLSIVPDLNEIKLHNNLLKGIPVKFSCREKLYSWINKISSANKKRQYYIENKLESLFDSLLSLQTFCKDSSKIYSQKVNNLKVDKVDLTDVTFLIRLRIDSVQRKENADFVIRSISNIFNTNISILEVDSEQVYIPEKIQGNLQYRFIEDRNEIFHMTKWTNQMISVADTPYVAIWDPDTFAAPEQVVEAVEKLRSGEVVMSFPYDGRLYSYNKIISDLIKSFPEIVLLKKYFYVMQLMNGFHNTRGSFLVDKKQYMSLGGENEKIYGWWLEDDERLKRMETLNLPLFYSKGPLFSLWHPTVKNNWFADTEVERKNWKEFLKT